ncbi:MAG: hypothetical protein ACXVCY_03210 [Pseudobdellovibrionaceae bacterium]
MKKSVVDLTVFLPRYRQALLFGMIEGLKVGEGFVFFDSLSETDVFGEFSKSSLEGYSWRRIDSDDADIVKYEIQKDFDKPHCASGILNE